MQVEIQNLTRVFGAFKAVDSVSFSFGDGEVVGFVGPNGAGKTTTMRIMATLDEPTSGDILIGGSSVVDYPELARRCIGFMPDSLPAHADITAREYIDFFGRAYGLRGAKLAQAVAAAEDFTGLGPIRDKPLKALSKGMKQRACLARALVHDPDLLIMDEPANGLDPRARIELRELVKILAENGKTILISSHILSELAEMCTGIVILEHGRLLSDRTRGGISAAAADAALNAGAAGVEIAAAETRARMRALGETPESLARKLLEIPGIVDAAPRAGHCLARIAGGEEEAAAFLAAAFARGIRVTEFRAESLGLEDVFMSVTKGDLQ